MNEDSRASEAGCRRVLGTHRDVAHCSARTERGRAIRVAGHRERPDQSHGRAPRSREVQGDHQGPHSLRRPPTGHRPQPRGRRLDRGATQKLWLRERRAVEVRLPAAAGTWTRWRGRLRGIRGRTGVNNDSLAQPDAKLRALNSQPSVPGRARRSIARRSVRRIQTRCTSSAATWTESAGEKRPTTTVRARRW